MGVKTIKTKYHEVTRLWLLDVVPLSSVGKFLDTCLEALAEGPDQFPIPNDKIQVKIGFREGNTVNKDGMKIEIPNNFGEKLSSYTAFAAMIRKGDASPALLPTGEINRLVHNIQKHLRSMGWRGWMLEFFWFSKHRFKS